MDKMIKKIIFIPNFTKKKKKRIIKTKYGWLMKFLIQV